MSWANTFFSTLHDLEHIDADANPLYIAGYNFVMDEVKDAILEGVVHDNRTLHEFINKMNTFSSDQLEGDYSNGYDDAVNICYEAIGKMGSA